MGRVTEFARELAQRAADAVGALDRIDPALASDLVSNLEYLVAKAIKIDSADKKELTQPMPIIQTDTHGDDDGTDLVTPGRDKST